MNICIMAIATHGLPALRMYSGLISKYIDANIQWTFFFSMRRQDEAQKYWQMPRLFIQAILTDIGLHLVSPKNRYLATFAPLGYCHAFFPATSVAFEKPMTAYFPETRQEGSSMSNLSATPSWRPTQTSAFSVRNASKLIFPARGPVALSKAVVLRHRASLRARSGYKSNIAIRIDTPCQLSIIQVTLKNDKIGFLKLFQ